jgi:hypothetical protein
MTGAPRGPTLTTTVRRERRRSVAELIALDAAGDPATGDPATGDPPFLAPLVLRLCAAYGGVPDEVRRSALELLANYAGARVQRFVPILVEKELRARGRKGWSSPDLPPHGRSVDPVG